MECTIILQSIQRMNFTVFRLRYILGIGGTTSREVSVTSRPGLITSCYCYYYYYHHHRWSYLSSWVMFKERFIWFSNSAICLLISYASLFKTMSRRAVIAFSVLLGGGLGISTVAALKDVQREKLRQCKVFLKRGHNRQNFLNFLFYASCRTHKAWRPLQGVG